jgi:hypothetical protein
MNGLHLLARHSRPNGKGILESGGATARKSSAIFDEWLLSGDAIMQIYQH